MLLKTLSIISALLVSLNSIASEGTEPTPDQVEESLIKQALERTSGNKNQASKLLQMNRTTLIEKMKKRNLSEFGMTQ